jgi:hypothetical protein
MIAGPLKMSRSAALATHTVNTASERRRRGTQHMDYQRFHELREQLLLASDEIEPPALRRPTSSDRANHL